MEIIKPYKTKQSLKVLYHAGDIPPSEAIKRGEKIYSFLTKELAEGWAKKHGKKGVYRIETQSYIKDLAGAYSRPILEPGRPLGYKMITSDKPEYMVGGITAEEIIKPKLEKVPFLEIERPPYKPKPKTKFIDVRTTRDPVTGAFIEVTTPYKVPLEKVPFLGIKKPKPDVVFVPRAGGYVAVPKTEYIIDKTIRIPDIGKKLKLSKIDVETALESAFWKTKQKVFPYKRVKYEPVKQFGIKGIDFYSQLKRFVKTPTTKYTVKVRDLPAFYRKIAPRKPTDFGEFTEFKRRMREEALKKRRAFIIIERKTPASRIFEARPPTEKVIPSVKKGIPKGYKVIERPVKDSLGRVQIQQQLVKLEKPIQVQKLKIQQVQKQRLRQKQKLGLAPMTKLFTSMDSALASALGVGLTQKQRQEQVQKQKQIQIQGQAQIQKQVQAQAQVQTQEQAQAQAQEQAQVQRTEQITDYFTIKKGRPLLLFFPPKVKLKKAKPFKRYLSTISWTVTNPLKNLPREFFEKMSKNIGKYL